VSCQDGGVPTEQLDYYLVFDDAGDRARDVPPRGLLVEEFVLRADYSSAGRDSAGWTPAGEGWWSSAAFSREIRVDPRLGDRVAVVGRVDATEAFRKLGGGELPDEPALRTFFHDRELAPAAAPLRLSAERAPAGFRERRVYSIVFAKSLDLAGWEAVWAAWRLAPVDDPADPQARVVGRARLDAAGHAFSWDLRRLGPGLGWCVDVTAHLGAAPTAALGALLRDLRLAMRRQGLIPITVERFA
jgi:hypothetical protein